MKLSNDPNVLRRECRELHNKIRVTTDDYVRRLLMVKLHRRKERLAAQKRIRDGQKDIFKVRVTHALDYIATSMANGEDINIVRKILEGKL
jgi:hypothetical protein